MKHYKSVELCQFIECQAHLLKISSDGSESAASSFAHKKPNLTQMKQEFKYLHEQWHGQPKVLGGSKCLILFEILSLKAQNDYIF